MFYQIKAIRKNSKPPIWRRILIPSNITFSQLAVILDEILEMPLLEDYVFEFYTKKERISEYREGVRLPSDYYYSAFDAAETYVNSYFDDEKWFTYKIPGMDHLPEYRLEIEKKIAKASVREKSTDAMITVAAPVIVKEVSMENDRYFTDAYSLNAELRKSYFLKEQDPVFENIMQAYERVSEGKGIAYSNNPVSRQTHVARSSQSYLKDFVERFDRLYENSSGQDLEHAKQDLIENLLKPNAGNKRHADNSQEEVPRHRTLEGFIKTYSLEDLQDIAEDIGYKTSEKDSRKLAKEIAARLLTEETMKEQLFFATEDDLDTFEEIIKKKGRTVDDADFDRYENIYDLGYYIAYDDGYVGVTDDIIRAYEKIGRENYREVHRQARWLYDCLRYTAYIYVILPVRQLYRIFKQKNGMDIGMDKFLSLFDEIPADHNPCVTIENKVIYKEVVKNDLYKDLEKKIADVGYYVPTPDNITVFLKDYYPADEPAYKKLHDYYANDLKWGEDNATEMCHVAARMFPMNGDISDYVDALKRSGLTLRKHEDVEKFSKLIIDVHNNTRMFDFRGHTPEEMTQLYPRDIEREIPTIVPMSTEAANILDADRKTFEKMGIKIDTESNAAKLKTAVFPQGPNGNVIQMTKKVYPNDPCPCGSGKKYKKCCGAK